VIYRSLNSSSDDVEWPLWATRLLPAFYNGIFHTVMQQPIKFHLKYDVAQSLSDSWAFCLTSALDRPSNHFRVCVFVCMCVSVNRSTVERLCLQLFTDFTKLCKQLPNVVGSMLIVSETNRSKYPNLEMCKFLLQQFIDFGCHIFHGSSQKSEQRYN